MLVTVLMRIISGLPQYSIIGSSAFKKLSDVLFNFIEKASVDNFLNENSLKYFAKPVSDLISNLKQQHYNAVIERFLKYHDSYESA